MTTYPVSFAEMAGEELPATLRGQRDGTFGLAKGFQARIAVLEARVAEMEPQLVEARREAALHKEAAAALDRSNSALREANRLLRLDLAAARGQSIEPDWTGTPGAPR